MGNHSSSSNNPEMSQQARTFIQDEIQSHDIVVFSKSYCPYCTTTKDLLRQKLPSVDVAVYELDRRPDGKTLQDELLTMTGQRTVPNVYVKGQHVGGNDDTQAAFRAGRLHQLLGLKQ
jgi:glutaredoxin 3